MNWKIILTLAFFGIAMGTASLFGLTERIEPLLWLFIAFFAAYWIAKRRAPKPFLHGLLSAVAMGVCNSLVQAAFFDMYRANNPTAAKGFSQIPDAIPGRYFILLIGPAIGLTYGLVVGLFAVIASKMLRKR